MWSGKVYKSVRVARYHPEWRDRDLPPLEPKYQVVRGFPFDCSCPTHVAFVGEGPGEDEDQAGAPFVGRSGEELDRFLETYHIDPDKTFISNIGRIFKVGNPDPTPEDVEIWTPLLQEELNVAKPWWIATLGRISTRYFLGDVDLEAVHGIPFLVVLPWLDNGRGGRVVVVPVYHPAAGFHSTELQANIAYDFAQLAATIDGRLTPRDPETADKFPDPEYIDLSDEHSNLTLIIDTLSGGTKANPMPVAIDTEGLPGNPWGLSYSVIAGQAFVIRKVHKLAMQVFYRHLIDGINAGRIHVILHNSLHDLRVLRELGIPIPDSSFTDTMVLAYHLCIEPQGLKPLAFRHAGMEMESYDEQVQEAQDRIAVEYYELIEALVSDGINYATPGAEGFTFTVRHDGQEPFTLEFNTRTEAEDAVIEIKKENTKRKTTTVVVEGVKVKVIVGGTKVKVSAIKRLVVEPSNPVSVGPFKYIDPYTVRAVNPETGQMVERMKHPQQIHTRVAKALKELRAGTITPAQLRKRWDNTDELVVDLVEEVIGPMREANLDDVPLGRAVKYAARDADATIRVYAVLKERHWSMGLERIGVIDHNIIPMVDRMQAVGLAVNRPYFIWLSADLNVRMLAVQQRIKDEFGIWMNPNSGDQVADILFESPDNGGYGLVATKKTKGTVDKETGEVKKRRGSTQDKVLEGLRNEHPIIPLILEYRSYNKAKTSFADVVIRRAVFEDGQWVIHCLFRITRVSSGRLSATGPNLMAVMGGKLGNEIREGYIAGEGYIFAEWDLNQVEMRVMASEANDEFLISMFLTDEDVHTGTANKMFNLGLSRPYNKKQVDKEKHRDPAKRTGFGVITGIQAPGLVDQMRLQGIIVTEEEAAKWIVDWLAACPGVPEYMGACHREARAFGYVRDWAGRIRYLPGIHSPFRNVRAEAGRQSHSHKIQSGAQSIMKLGMYTIWTEVLPYWREQGKYVEPVLQVHDSLMLRVKTAEAFGDEGFNADELEILNLQIRGALFGAAPPNFRIPLDAGSGMAATWGSLEH